MIDSENLESLFSAIRRNTEALLRKPSVPLGLADPPRTPGVYALSWDGNIQYVGEAKGRGGLRDRLLNKHISGDDSHAIQRAFMDAFPDRGERRLHIIESVEARWIDVPLEQVSATERAVIWLLNPAHNRA